jgi:spermidine synthase
VQQLLAGADDGRSRLLVVMSAFLMLPICVLSGAQFGLIGQALHGRVRHSMQSTGLLTLANTLGAAVGPLLSAFVLLPFVGVEGGFFCIAVLYGVAAFLVRDTAAEKTQRWVRPLAQAAVFGGVLACFPFGLMQSSFFQSVAARLPGATLVHAREGLSETSFYFRHDAMGRPFYHRLVTHGYSMSSSDPRSKRYMKLFAWLPLALHPEARDALLICFGVGSTARALADTPELRRIDVVDISRDILQSSDLIFPDPSRNPLRDPRVTTRVEDGRFYLQTTDRKYDLITGEPPPTKIAGVVNLYTEEFFRLVRQRLNAGGYCSYWLPVYQMQADEARAIVRAFLNVFPDATLWEGGGLNWTLLGRNGAGPVPSAAQFAGAWNQPEVAAEMAALGLESPGQLGATFLADARDLARFCGAVPPLSDAHPHRISTDMRDRAPNAPAYREMMDDDEARRRFSTSPWVEANLPGEIRAASTVLFRAQRFVNYALYPAYRPEPERAAGDLREVLASTRLQTLPLWLLGSSPQELAIAQTAVPSGAGGSEVEFHLAAGALAHRDSAAAAEHLRASIRQGGHGADARLQLLLKALSGGAIPNHGLVVGSGAASTQ